MLARAASPSACTRRSSRFVIRDIGLYRPVLELAREDDASRATPRRPTVRDDRRRVRPHARRRSPKRRSLRRSATTRPAQPRRAARPPTRTSSSRTVAPSRSACRCSASICSPRSAGACCRTASGASSPRFRACVGDQDRAVQPVSDDRRRAGRRRSGPRRHRAVHRQRRQHRRRPAHAIPRPVGGTHVRRIDGGLLGQWAVWTRAAVQLLERDRRRAATTIERQLARARRGAHRCQRRDVRRGARVRRLHSRHSRGAASAGAARGHLVSRSERDAVAGTGARRSTGSAVRIPP